MYIFFDWFVVDFFFEVDRLFIWMDDKLEDFFLFGFMVF